MAAWNVEPRWVSEDGLRSYLTAADDSGPSRLDCYRRLLSEPDDIDAARQPSTGLALRLAALADLARGGWRKYPGAIATVLHLVGQ